MKNARKYLIVPIVALAMLSCKQKITSTTESTVQSAAAKADTIISDTNITPGEMPEDKPVPVALLIVPGTSVGQTSLNEKAEEVINKLGKPDASDAAMGKSLAVWYAGHDTSAYKTQIFFSRNMGVDDTARVQQIRITSPAFKVNNKVYAGMPLKNATAFYKLVKVGQFKEKGNSYTIYDDVTKGIAFDADSKDNISGIAIYEPGRATKSPHLPFYPGF